MQMTIYHCAHCDGLVPDGRADKKYCSNSCKQKNYRWRKKQDRYLHDAKRNITALAVYLDYPETSLVAASFLAEIANHIKNSARVHGARLQSVK